MQYEFKDLTALAQHLRSVGANVELLTLTSSTASSACHYAQGTLDTQHQGDRCGSHIQSR